MKPGLGDKAGDDYWIVYNVYVANVIIIQINTVSI